MGKTLYDKLWDAHVVEKVNESDDLLYIDRHFLHEVTSPQAFSGLREAKRKLWRVSANVAVPDHNVPTTKDRFKQSTSLSSIQIDTLKRNCEEFNVQYFGLSDKRQGIVHVIGPELGLTLPGMTIVCGDSHTSTHGALGTISMGIGTSEVEHALATQCIIKKKLKTMNVRCNNALPLGIEAKDLILHIIKTIGTDGATGYAMEYTGEIIRALNMSSRMTICNMSIEAGAQCGLMGVDKTVIDFIQDKPYAPKSSLFYTAKAYWETLVSDPDAEYDKIVDIECLDIEPQVTWGTSPEMTISVNDPIPSANGDLNLERALSYMEVKSGTKLSDYTLDYVFIGSCTNGRIEDLRIAAKIVMGKKVASNVKALVVPGSQSVKHLAEKEGLDKVFKDAGFSWREPGCSMCLGMNPDILSNKERCASTSNRNFEGRQGPGAKTHLVSPGMAAAAAIAGRICDVREFI